MSSLRRTHSQVANSQVGRQTAAEVGSLSKWALHVGASRASWPPPSPSGGSCLRRGLGPLLGRADARRWRRDECRGPGAGAAGDRHRISARSHAGSQRVRSVARRTTRCRRTRFWYISANGQRMIERERELPDRLPSMMPEQTALRLARDTIAPGAQLPLGHDTRLVHATTTFRRPAPHSGPRTRRRGRPASCC